MATTPTPVRCFLCEQVLEDGNVPQHLRMVHQVLVGERTHVDVPLGHIRSPKPIKMTEHAHEDEKRAARV